MRRLAAIMAFGTVPVSSAPSNNLLRSLVSYWKLDEASGTRNDSNGTNHLTDNNTVGSTTGVIGNAAQFTAASSRYLSCTSNSTLQMSSNTDFTFSFWVKLVTTTSQQLISKDDDAANSRDYTIDYEPSGGQGVRIYIKGGGTYICTSSSGGTGTWYFIVAWYDSSNGQLHVRTNDGTTFNAGTTGATGTDVSAAQFRIGAREYAGFEGYSDAAIDEVGMWKRLLTSSEITTLYGSGAGFPYSSFGLLTPDIINEGFEGTGTPGGWFRGGSANFDYSAVPLSGSQSLRCDSATSDVAELQSGGVLNHSEVWVKFLVKFESLSTGKFFSFDDGSFNFNYATLYAVSGSLYIGDSSPVFQGTTDTMTTGVSYNVWMHWKKGTGSNGILEASFDVAGNPRPTGGNKFTRATNSNGTANVVIARLFPGNTTVAVYDDFQLSSTDIF